MRVDALRAVDFRLYERVEAQIGAGLTGIVGPNGAGKTSLLEAIHFGTLGYSPRTTNEALCVRHGMTVTRVEVDGARRLGPQSTSVGFAAGEAKRILVDGAAARSVEALGERWACLVFLPDRLAVVKHAPSVRRAWLDRAIARLMPAYGRTATAYGRALVQRNALLRRVRTGAADASALEPWEQQLAELGAAVATARRRLCERLATPFAERLALLGGDAGEAALTYQPRSAETVAGLTEELAAARRRDVERAVTTVGPHLDDVLLRDRDRDVRAYGSQGEQRTVVLALLLAEAAVLADVRGEQPVLLLDDVLSELDRDRRALLLEAVRSHGQALVTATAADGLQAADRVLVVERGRLHV